MKQAAKKTYIMVPGGWHGGWSFDPIKDRLIKTGHDFVALTLPGLEHPTLPHKKIINLDTHIRYVVDQLVEQNFSQVVLCAHSYGGLVTTGVADQIPEKIHSLVYIDAYIPENGDSCWKLTSEVYRDLFIEGVAHDGYTVAVPPGTEKRRVPHPVATFMQALHLTGRYKQIRNRVFVYASGWAATPFKKQYESLKNNPEWHLETIHCGHNVMREAPEKLATILEKIADL
jgi:pimeloyl-ACP methyl ester carboxylesterase